MPEESEEPEAPGTTSGAKPEDVGVARAILFADMGGSTALYEKLGDVEAHRIAAHCLSRISQVVARHDGRVIKTIGDEVMAAFESAHAAYQAARDIQLDTTGDEAGDHPPFPVHVGFHYGRVLEEGNDVFGDAVNLAARMVGLARTGEILTTRETVAALPPAARGQTREVDRRAVKGRREEIYVFEVIWQDVGLTALHPIPAIDEETAHSCLIFELGGRRHELSPDTRELRIGRSDDNELVVTDRRASRHHATACFQQGKFVLRDASTNGTVVHPRGKKPLVLRREEMILPPAGSISIGMAEDPLHQPPIQFHSEPWWPRANED